MTELAEKGIGKAAIVGELTGSRFLLPQLVMEALSANARIKFALSWLQAAETSAGHNDRGFADLAPERRLAGLEKSALFETPSVTVESDGILLPQAGAILAGIGKDVARMRSAVQAGADAGLIDARDAAGFPGREQAIAKSLVITADTLSPGLVSALSRPPQEGQDSLHGLVMDLHKALNRIAAALSEEDVDGARAWRLEKEDKIRVAAFMRGLNRTAILKFGHPGLATNAMRDGTRLMIQNDIGTTDAHVLIAYVEGLTLSVTYSDIHHQRLKFFQNRLTRFSWTVSDRHSANLEEDIFYLATGQFQAENPAALDDALEQLGANLVFLIDWNKARKSLGRLVSRKSALQLLDWAAKKEVGHRAYLEAGGDAVIGGLLETVSKATGGFYISLQSALGEDGAVQFLKEMLRLCSDEMRKGTATAALRDLLRADLLTRVASISDRILDLAIDHAALTLDLGDLVRAALLEGQAAPHAVAERGARLESLADHQVGLIRDLCGSGRERAWRDIGSAADNAADELEEVTFYLQVLPGEIPAGARDGLLLLAEQVVSAIKYYVRLLCALRNLRSGAPRQEMRESLAFVEKLHDEEHATDKAERDVFCALMGAEVPAKTLHVVTAVAAGLERTADELLRVGRLITDHAVGEWFGT
jgi:hypothetical protein